jgi:anti-sigma factor RsiW
MRNAMECFHVQDKLSAWLDDELDEATAAALSAHVEQCAACRRAWHQLRALNAALDRLTVPTPAGLAEKVAARLPRRPRRQWWQSVALAACLVMGVALGSTLARSFHGLTTPSDNNTEVASLEVFQDFPQGSLGTVVASYQPQEGNGDQP